MCRSLRTKRNGTRSKVLLTAHGSRRRTTHRYYCHDCHRSFARTSFSKKKRHSYQLISDAVKRVVEDYTSYRRVAARVSVSAPAVLGWVNTFGKQAKSPIEIAHDLDPQWSGILGVDGKSLNIEGTEACILIAVDLGTGDPFFFQLVDAEDEEHVRRFFLIIKKVFHYPISAIVSDLGKGRVFVQLAEDVFPGVPHQACVVHFSRYVDMTLPKSKKSKYHQQNAFLRQYVDSILFAQSLNDADEMLCRLQEMEHLFQRKYQRQVIRSLRRNFHLLTTHFSYQDVPRDTNVVENVIRQLNRKLIQMNGFKNRDNAYAFLKLRFCAQRFRPFTCSRYSHRNGLSPLELADVNITGLDWLKFSQNSNL